MCNCIISKIDWASPAEGLSWMKRGFENKFKICGMLRNEKARYLKSFVQLPCSKSEGFFVWCKNEGKAHLFLWTMSSGYVEPGFLSFFFFFKCNLDLLLILAWHNFFLKILFIYFRQRGRGEGNINVWLPLLRPLLGRSQDFFVQYFSYPLVSIHVGSIMVQYSLHVIKMGLMCFVNQGPAN